jgi:hypothetical protein
MQYTTRYFNKIIEDQNFLYKQSSNIEKIKAEYDYYYYLPHELKHYFVQPQDFLLESPLASYKMQKMYIEDAAKQIVNYSMDIKSFRNLLNKIEDFKNNCDEIRLSQEDGFQEAQKIVLTKTIDRLDKLNIPTGDLYFRLSKAFDYYKHERIDWNLKISHGDLCLSNILWNGNILLIDPKGALNKNDIYMDEYYDMAKLSHSIIGGYDFINNEMYDFKIGQEFIEEFKIFLETNNVNFKLLRVYEASLFLSMLPFHIENTKKISYFLNQCDIILKEIGF